MNKPFFSIIVPTYNRKPLLKEALLSINAQTFTNYEIIVIDDGSNDDTETMVKSFNFPIKFIKIDHCGKAGAVRNRGVKEAEAPYLAFLDSDDLWLANKLQLQYQKIQENSQIKLLHSKEQWLRGDTIVSQQSQTHLNEGDIFKESLVKCIIGPSTAVIEHQFFNTVGGFNPTLEIAEDYELWLRCLNLEPCYYNKESLIVKRQGNWPNLSAKYDEIEGFRITALEILLAETPLKPHNKKLSQTELGRKLALYIAGALKREQGLKAQHYTEKLRTLMQTYNGYNQ